MITVAIPTEKHSEQLDTTLEKLAITKQRYSLDLRFDSTMNVAEARQQMLQDCTNPYICFIDYDSEMIDPDWLTKMLQTIQQTNAAIVCCNEIWGTSQVPLSHQFDPNYKHGQDYPITFGPAACMLMDVSKCKPIQWDYYMGLRNGWLGGDVEEVDFCFKVLRAGHSIYRCNTTAFHHTGGKTDINCYSRTDRGQTASIMMDLLQHKYRTCPDNTEYFKELKYIKAQDANDLMAESGALRECYRDVILANGLGHLPSFKKKGLV
jgi:hypothetical protein